MENKMKKFCRLNAITLALFLLVLGTVVTLDAVTYEPLPNNSPYRGLFYYISMAEYQDLLIPTMPPEIMVGYSVADSIVRSAPHFPEDVVKNLNLESDTMAYLFKFWTIMNDWHPPRFQSFLSKKHPDAKVAGHSVEGALYMRTYKDPRLDYVYPPYILHVYVNDVIQIDTSFAKGPYIKIKGYPLSLTTAYCKVLYNFKGKVLPSLQDAIIYNGELPDSGNSIISAIPPQTDLAFSYMDYWQRWDGGPYLLGWIKPGKEYIVFLEVNGRSNLRNPDGSINKHYYSITPFRQNGSRSMYPIENGIVRDEGNILGFGEREPLNIFKQNIINKLEEIKNYGE